MGHRPGVKALRVALWIATAAAGFAVARVFWDGLEPGVSRDAVSGGSRSAASWFSPGSALLYLYRGRDRRETLLGPAIAVAFVIVALGVAVDASKGNNDQLVSDYCSYGVGRRPSSAVPSERDAR